MITAVKGSNRQTILWVCTVILVTMLLSSLLAPLLGLRSFEQMNLKQRLSPPSGTHWLGTDELGRDVLSRLLHGGRISFLVSVVVGSISFVIGVLFGSIAAFAGRWPDEVLMRTADVLLAFPGLLLAI